MSKKYCMEEFKEKVEAIESILFGWFWILLLSSVILVAIDSPILANLALWGSLLAFIIQKIIRIYDICFLMTADENIKRLFLVTVNITLLCICGYIFFDLISRHDFQSFVNLKSDFLIFLRRLGI